jgi:hypothetical protein
MKLLRYAYLMSMKRGHLCRFLKNIVTAQPGEAA